MIGCRRYMLLFKPQGLACLTGLCGSNHRGSLACSVVQTAGASGWYHPLPPPFGSTASASRCLASAPSLHHSGADPKTRMTVKTRIKIQRKSKIERKLDGQAAVFLSTTGRFCDAPYYTLHVWKQYRKMHPNATRPHRSTF